MKALLREKRGAGAAAAVAAWNPLLRGWTSYFRHAQVKDVWQELDGWVRRKLRGRLGRQGKRPGAGQDADEARIERRGRSAPSGRGAWWNAGASHMNAAFPKSFFDHMGLVSLVDTHRRFQSQS